mgnify:FL=1
MKNTTLPKEIKTLVEFESWVKENRRNNGLVIEKKGSGKVPFGYEEHYGTIHFLYTDGTYGRCLSKNLNKYFSTNFNFMVD